MDYHVGAAVNIASCALYLEQTCRGELSSVVESRLKLMFGSIWLPRTEALTGMPSVKCALRCSLS